MTTSQIRRGNADGRDSVHWASGWTVFAAALMILVGGMAIFQGIAAIAKDDVFVTTGNYVYTFNLTSWGWIHLALGVLVVLAGFALFSGALWARIVGVFLAGLSMIANFMWLPHYPFWAITLIAIDALVIWALCVGPERNTR
jgi:hypothetical protein